MRNIKEIDMATNTIDSGLGLEPFQALEKLTLDHNRIVNLSSFPHIDSLKNLSISYNNISDFDMMMAALFLVSLILNILIVSKIQSILCFRARNKITPLLELKLEIGCLNFKHLMELSLLMMDRKFWS